MTRRERPHLAPLAVTFAEASVLSGVPEPTLRELVARGEIASVQYGQGKHRRRYLIRPADLAAWIEHQRVPARWETSAGPAMDAEDERPSENAVTSRLSIAALGPDSRGAP